MALSERSRESTGVLFGLAAYGIWGLTPAYWKALDGIPPIELIAQRVLWSLVLAAMLLVNRRRSDCSLSDSH